ncbi:MAG: type II toxin-antitoxin system VapC family toxin [Roseibium album]|uniref:type II toxin-antitoxin system VapC family toxin n=1 Tax=Roseibium album TaxID=311410 RepID=UPI0032EF6071
MACIVVNDASCLIDLRKGQLLHVLCALPHRFLVPLPIRESELLDFTDQEWRMLDDSGLETYDVPPDHMREVFTVKQRHSRLSANDCMCLVTSQVHENAILLTGDGLLRKVATAVSVRVHGVLWVIDELHRAGLCSNDLLTAALMNWRNDPAVFLPGDEIDTRLANLQRSSCR